MRCLRSVRVPIGQAGGHPVRVPCPLSNPCGLKVVFRLTGARLFAGAGIVENSDPQAELAETELKLAVIRAVLTG